MSTIYGEDISEILPIDAIQRDWRLYWIEPLPDADPIHLRDSKGNVLYDWPWGYIPSLTEIFEVCEQLKRSEAER